MRLADFLALRGINESRLDLVEEFRGQVFGHHSADLETLLNTMRSGFIHGKFFLLMTRVQEEWTLARFSETDPLTWQVFEEHRFDSIEAAEWAVFCERWRAIFGVRLEGAPIAGELR
jgi:hypothetical protein